MIELSKKDILTLIGENITSIRHSGYEGFGESADIEEMPIDPSHREWPRQGDAPDPDEPAKKTGKLNTWTRLYSLDDNDKVVEHVGWFGRDPESEKSIPIIFTCEWDELVTKYPDLVPKLKEKFGVVNLVEKNCISDKPRGSVDSLGIKPIPGSDEVAKVTDTQYRQSFDKETGEFKTTLTAEKIKRDFNQILKSELENDEEFKNALKKYSFPQIVVSGDKFRNRYTDTNNEEIVFQSHNINVYKTQEEFAMSVRNSLRERDPANIPDKPNRSLRRLYNTIYSNWPKTRFTQVDGYGKTPVFKLDVGDFPNDEKFEVMVSSDVKVIGNALEKNEDGQIVRWGWSIEYRAEYAKKKPTDRVARSLNRDVEISKSTEVRLSEPKKFDGQVEKNESGRYVSGDKGDNHPLTDVNIKQGLMQLLEEFKQELTSSKTRSVSLQRSMADLASMANNLNENEIKDLVGKILKQVK